MTSASPGIVASAMENRLLRDSGRIRARRRRRARHGVPRSSSTTDCSSRSTRPISPWNGTRCSRDAPLAEFLGWVELVVDAINHALAGIDPGSVRLHVCWGNYEGPHTHDVAARRDPPPSLRSQCRRPRPVDGECSPRARARVLRAPPAPRPHGARRRRDRHDEQLRRARGGRCRPHRASRRVRSAILVGCIAGTDCGFDTSAGIGDVAPSVVWEKLSAMRHGADLATDRLF